MPGGLVPPAQRAPAVEVGAVDGAQWQALALATGFGLTAALLVVAGVLGGRWLDGILHTSPVFTVVGLLLGLLLGGLVFLRQVARIFGGSGR